MQVSIVVTSSPRSVAALALPVGPPAAVTGDVSSETATEDRDRAGVVLASPLAEPLVVTPGMSPATLNLPAAKK